LILAIIAISKANECQRTYEMYPGRFTEASLNSAKAGKICAIISLSLLALAIVILIGVFVIVA
jgi:hypothetical protein